MGRGFERRFGEKKLEGSGTTEDSTCGNTKGECFLVRDIVLIGTNGSGNGDEGGGNGFL